MALLNITETDQQKIDRNVIIFKRGLRTDLSQLHRIVETRWQQFWKNPEVEPAQMATALGTDCKAAFILIGTLMAVAASQGADWSEEFAAPYNYVVNDDGTVTIGTKKDTPPASEGT